MKKYNFPEVQIAVKKLNKRWGSCDRLKKKITLNVELIKCPVQCIEYVFMHELVHLKYKNHDKKFYTFFSQVMPEWKKRKLRLELSPLI